VPNDVVEFWRNAKEADDPISLSTLSLDVHRWLIEHGATDMFAVCKR
jgi:hypothetical protein